MGLEARGLAVTRHRVPRVTADCGGGATVSDRGIERRALCGSGHHKIRQREPTVRRAWKATIVVGFTTPRIDSLIMSAI